MKCQLIADAEGSVGSDRQTVEHSKMCIFSVTPSDLWKDHCGSRVDDRYLGCMGEMTEIVRRQDTRGNYCHGNR